MGKRGVLVLIIIFIAAGSAATHAQETVSGTVFLDENGNAKMDPGEEGIPEIAVSNGREVTLSDEDGSYQLPIEEEMIVFIRKPAGYKLPLNENNLPRFSYYIHHPEGSPELEYPGLEPTGPLPESVNFGLIPSEKKESFTAIAFGDPQPRDNQELSYFRDDIVPELADAGADMTLVLGDIMFDDLSMSDRYNRIMKTVGSPVYNILGNHDINYDTEGNRYAKESFKSHYGPTYFSFDYGDVHFIALDNIDYMGQEGDDHGGYRGYLSDIQLEWIHNDLRHVDNDKLIVLLAHIPLYSSDSDAEGVNTVNREALFDLLEDRDRVLFLGGHRHMTFQHFLGEEFGRSNASPIHHIATTAACGSWWRGPKNEQGIPIATQMDGVPNGYHIIKFEGNTYRERYKAAGKDPGFQMRIEMPVADLTAGESKNSDVVVNLFNGSERSEVRFQIDDGEWREMQQQDELVSPFYESLHENYEGPWSTPNPTNHIWTAKLPELSEGIHKITVWTQDMYGQEFTQSKVVELK
ncbi:MAG TPA: calcineurin-like phosphoesterase family protein [Fodinibius sp.]|nr:calcineurin-like phosphoesterase family protein [Fodinibius sp.]